jgi:hypothetical protein
MATDNKMMSDTEQTALRNLAGTQSEAIQAAAAPSGLLHCVRKNGALPQLVTRNS